MAQLCAVLAWCSWEWAGKIAASLMAGLAANVGPPWQVVLLSGTEHAGPEDAVDCGTSEPQSQGQARYVLHVVAAERIGQVAERAQEGLARGTADWVVVDCTLAHLDAACRAVQALPRWPLAWLPRGGVFEDGALDPLVTKVTRRLEAVSAGAPVPRG